jgi:citronellol/citronellal dehydrogenase
MMGDGAVQIVARPSREAAGTCYIDSEVLQSSGVVDLSHYGGGGQPIGDLFLE